MFKRRKARKLLAKLDEVPPSPRRRINYKTFIQGTKEQMFLEAKQHLR